MRAYVVAHGIRLERERIEPGTLVTLSAHQEHQRTGDVSARVDVHVALRRSLECRGDRSLGLLCDLPAPRWCGSMRLTMWSNRRRARVALCAVASSGLGPSRVSSNRLRLTNRSGRGASCSRRCGGELEAWLHGSWEQRGGVAIHSHENQMKLRSSRSVVKCQRSVVSALCSFFGGSNLRSCSKCQFR
jgi:hypothetical protein